MKAVRGICIYIYIYVSGFEKKGHFVLYVNIAMGWKQCTRDNLCQYRLLRQVWLYGKLYVLAEFQAYSPFQKPEGGLNSLPPSHSLTVCELMRETKTGSTQWQWTVITQWIGRKSTQLYANQWKISIVMRNRETQHYALNYHCNVSSGRCFEHPLPL